jgi:hypothetical protein
MERAGIENGSELFAFMEHRWGKRMPCQARVRICASAGISGTGCVRDISSSGAFIETTLALTECTPLTLFIRGNESAVRDVEVAAIVVRIDPDGVGVEWCETPVGSVCAMAGCVTRCAKNRTRQSAEDSPRSC